MFFFIVCVINEVYIIINEKYSAVNLSYVTFQGNSQIWSHKTGGRLIQVLLIWNGLWKEIKIKVT